MPSGEDSQRAPAHDALGLVRASNRALVRSVDESQLLKEICRIAVEIGRYRMAWVGLSPEDTTTSVRPVAWSGDEAGYLSSIQVDLDRGTDGQEPVARAIRTGEPVVVERLAEISRRAAWVREARARGYESILVLPLRNGGKALGALAIYADESDAFGHREVDLLSELSEDLGFGLVTIRLRAERARLAAAVEQTADSITVTDPHGRVVYVNPAFERRSGFLRSDVIGSLPRGLRGERADAVAFDTMWSTVRRGEIWTGTLANISKDGRDYEEETVVSPLRDDGGHFVGFVASGRDTTRERELEGQLTRRVRDEAELATRLSRLRRLETPEATAAAIVDELASLPGFDFLAVGYFAAVDEFVPLALRVPPTAPLAVGRPLPASRSAYLHGRAGSGPWLEAWHARPEDGAYGAQMAAVGVKAAAYAPINGPTSVVGLLIMGTSRAAIADRIGDQFPAAMSFAAIAGALLGPMYEQHRDEVAARAEIEAIIGGEAFEPVFQPIVKLADRRIVGYEALTRFTDGTPPAERFVRAARLAIGPQLELACLRRALNASRALPDDVWLTLNASPELVLSSNLLAPLLATSSRPLVLEVTEHAPVDDYAALRRAAASLGPLVRLAVDDAGAGYAGLRQILELRADIVKLDLGLVRGVESDPARQALIAGMVHFAGRTRCTLLAEGIETEAEARTLLDLGVELGQGYLFGRPSRIAKVIQDRDRVPGIAGPSRRGRPSRLPAADSRPRSRGAAHRASPRR